MASRVIGALLAVCLAIPGAALAANVLVIWVNLCEGLTGAAPQPGQLVA